MKQSAKSPCFLVLVLLLTIAASAPCGHHSGQEANLKPIRMLIVDGFSNHDWQQTTRVVRQILESSKLFDIDVSTAPLSPSSPEWDTWRPRFSAYDVVLQNTNNIGKHQLRWPREVEVDLENYVKSGGGLYIFHSANNAFAHWKEYDRMIGLGWRGKDGGTALEIAENGKIIRIRPGEGRGTSHGPRLDVVVRILNRHPINDGFPEYWKTPSLEVYVYARGPAENLTVLSYAFDKPTEKYWPIEWVIQYGKGRVYNSTFGHLWRGETMPVSMRCIGFQTTLIRACEWLATGKVTWPVPARFPSKNTCRLSGLKPLSSPKEILIIQDELPQMKVLAEFLKNKGNLSVTIADQNSYPKDISSCKAVIVFIHKDLFEKTEKDIINFTKNGGRLICLHHSISSKKALNKFYFDFLGVQLDKGTMEDGGYKWKDGRWTLVNLNSEHYITNHNVNWEDIIPYISSHHPSVEKLYPAIQLKEDSEVFINHKFTDAREKTVLCGLVYKDSATGKTYMQDRGAWIKKRSSGTIFYFMPGHSVSDYKNENIAQMILNAVEWDWRRQ